jgi:hypothetical protein
VLEPYGLLTPPDSVRAFDGAGEPRGNLEAGREVLDTPLHAAPYSVNLRCELPPPTR